MANKENTTLRIEPDLKKQAAALFRACLKTFDKK